MVPINNQISVTIVYEKQSQGPRSDCQIILIAGAQLLVHHDQNIIREP